MIDPRRIIPAAVATTVLLLGACGSPSTAATSTNAAPLPVGSTSVQSGQDCAAYEGFVRANCITMDEFAASANACAERFGAACTVVYVLTPANLHAEPLGLACAPLGNPQTKQGMRFLLSVVLPTRSDEQHYGLDAAALLGTNYCR